MFSELSKEALGQIAQKDSKIETLQAELRAGQVLQKEADLVCVGLEQQVGKLEEELEDCIEAAANKVSTNLQYNCMVGTVVVV